MYGTGPLFIVVGVQLRQNYNHVLRIIIVFSLLNLVKYVLRILVCFGQFLFRVRAPSIRSSYLCLRDDNSCMLSLAEGILHHMLCCNSKQT